MSTFDRYLFRDLVSTFSAVFIVLELVVTIAVASRLLEKVTVGSYPINTMGFLIAYAGLDSLPIVLPLAAFLAVMLTFGRYYRDNEAFAAFAVGVGYADLSKTILRFALPLAAFLLVFMFETMPYMEKRYQINKLAASTGTDIGIVTAGRFINLDNGVTLFVEENDTAEDEIRNIFVARMKAGEDTFVETAKIGRQVTESDGQKRLHLSQGQRYQGLPGLTNFQVTHFNAHWIELPHSVSLQALTKPEHRRMHELLASDNLADQAELQRRISMPLSLVVLSLFAFALIRPSPHRGIRRDRYAKVGLGIVLFLVYLNGIITLTKLISNSEAFVYILWAVQGLILILVGMSLSGVFTRLRFSWSKRSI